MKEFTKIRWKRKLLWWWHKGKIIRHQTIRKLLYNEKTFRDVVQNLSPQKFLIFKKFFSRHIKITTNACTHQRRVKNALLRLLLRCFRVSFSDSLTLNIIVNKKANKSFKTILRDKNLFTLRFVFLLNLMKISLLMQTRHS